jgi:hypothetical protein
MAADACGTAKAFMKHKLLTLVMICVSAAALPTGCSHKTDAKTELDTAATLLDKTESAPVASAPAPESAAPMATAPAAVPESVAGLAATPAQQMHLAISSYKTGDLEDAVTRLQKLRATPTLTAEQRMAVQDSVAAVMTEIYTLAAKGDAKAIQAVKQYEVMQTSR